jgi:excisionase family DNA binding protein
MTSEEVAAALSCAPRTARLLAQTGAISATRVHSRLWLFDRADVESFASRRRDDHEPAA